MLEDALPASFGCIMCALSSLVSLCRCHLYLMLSCPVLGQVFAFGLPSE